MRRVLFVLPTLALLVPTTAFAQPVQPVSPPTRRFDATPIPYEVPSSETSGGFYSTAMGTTNKHWLLYDMNEDGKLDIVQTRDPKDPDAVFGNNAKNDHWRVFFGTATGSNTSLSPMWGLPSSGTDGGFRGFAAGQTIRQWAVVNFERRKAPVLIQTQDPTTSKVWKTPDGHFYWKLFRTDSNARFGKNEVKVIVGNAGKEKGFYSVVSGSNTDQWLLMDLNKDGRLDLVQTANPETGKVWAEGSGKKYWRVYWNNPGFGASEIRMDVPTQWQVPELAGSGANGVNVTTTNDGNKQWVTFDIDGDGIPDLVQTADPATGKVWGAGTTNTYWKVYKKDGWGFSKTAINWSVPPSGTADGFDSATSGTGNKNWVTIDLDGDLKPDLVQTSNTADGKAWGAGTPTHSWRVFKNTGTGFSDAGTVFNIPDSGTADGFKSITSADNNKFWMVVDIDGDGRLDLVHTADPATGDVWKKIPPNANRKEFLAAKPFWKVYRGIP
jgi:hypothetical protein